MFMAAVPAHAAHESYAAIPLPEHAMRLQSMLKGTVRPPSSVPQNQVRLSRSNAIITRRTTPCTPHCLVTRSVSDGCNIIHDTLDEAQQDVHTHCQGSEPDAGPRPDRMQCLSMASSLYPRPSAMASSTNIINSAISSYNKRRFPLALLQVFFQTANSIAVPQTFSCVQI